MAFDIIPKSLYPVVPQALGVPALLRSGAQLLDTVTLGYLGASDALNSIIGSEPIKWGIFDNGGNLIGDYDSVLAVGYQNDSRISDYPVEQGQFASYNKVDNPFDVNVKLICGGSENRRATFLAACEMVRKSLQGYSVITPTATYQNVNFTSISTENTTQEGANIAIVTLTGREIRNTPTASYSDSTNLGAVQTVDDPNFDASGIV